ncbi:MAG: hypothetical protein ACREIL_01280 [Nitrospiraceae bacterium]
MRPAPHRMPLPIPRLAWLLGLILLAGLAGCGPPSSDQAPGLDSRAAAPNNTAAVAPETNRPAPTQTSGRGPAALPAPTKPGLLRTESSRGRPPAPEARAPSTAASLDTQPREARAAAERAQQDAWAQWYAAVREHPDVSVRLQALEQWAQQPGEAIDPVTAALVDEDEQVRGRAQDLYDQQLTREASRARPVREEGQNGGTTP